MADPVEIPYRHNLYKGLPVPDFITPERYKELETIHQSRVDDVFIATYQKSGTTWLQHILYELYDHPQGEVENINDGVPWIEEYSQDKIDALVSPRIFKTHDRWDWIPKGNKVKYIYCYRNPKDVCCSYYNHMKNVFVGHYKYSGSLSEFFSDIFIKPNTSEQGWYFDHVAGWLEQKGNPNILFLTYEDMVEDLKREVLKIVKFLGLQCTEEKIDCVVNSSLFDSMSKNPKVNYTWRDGDKKDPNSKFIRKGKVGSWQDELTKEQSNQIDKLTRDLLEVPFGIKIRDTL